jgi:DNA-binding response OmpR family regulator
VNDPQKARVLYVEDDPDFRDAIRTMLEANGYRVRLAATAEEGLEAFRDETPDAALLDLMIEEVDSGLSLATRIRAASPHVPIFLLTSVGDALMDTHDWGRLGVTGVLQKPVSAATLLPILENALQPQP